MSDNDFGPIVIGKLMNIGGMLQKKANQLLLPYDLNQQQFSILFEIKKAGRVNQKTMVNRLSLEKAHVSKIIKKLNSMGLIEISVSDADKRSSWVSVTEKGSDIVNECRKTINEWNQEWIGGIDPEKRPGILGNLTDLQAVFKNCVQNE